MTRKITPISRQQFDWIAKTYGIGKELDAWCREIVKAAHKRKRPPTELKLIDILDEVGNLAKSGSRDWVRSIDHFKNGGWLTKVEDIIALLRHRTPPHKVRQNSRAFSALTDGPFQVEVQIVYEIDLSANHVTFLHFESCSPAKSDLDPSRKAQKW